METGRRHACRVIQTFLFVVVEFKKVCNLCNVTWSSEMSKLGEGRGREGCGEGGHNVQNILGE